MGLFSFFQGEDARPEDRREAPRFDSVPVACSLGEVVNLSLSGLAVACKGRAPERAGTLVEFTMKKDGHAIPFTARIVRVKPGDGRRYELGLHFLALSDGQKRFVLSLIGTGASWHSAEKKSRVKSKGAAPAFDPYAVLGLAPGASEEAVRHAFHELARKFHPDASHTGDTAKQFQRVHEAYAYLKAQRDRTGAVTARP